MRGSIPGWLRASAALTFVAVVALQTAGDVGADPEAEATDVITVAAVDANGEPANGYSVVDRLTTSVSPRRCCACAIRGAGHFVVLSPLAHSLRWTPRKHRCRSRWFSMTAPAACYALATSGAAGLTAWSRHTAAACRAGRMRFWHRLTRTSWRRSTARNRCGGCRPATWVRPPPDSGPHGHARWRPRGSRATPPTECRARV